MKAHEPTTTAATVKLVLIGASGVGKTSIRSQYISGRFSSSYRATIGADFITKTLPHPTSPDKSVALQIWDTAGQERFSSLSSAFFRGADAALLMFDVNEPRSMHALVNWWDEFKIHAPLADEDAEDYCCIVVGNKMDMVENGAARVSAANALRFLDVLVPPLRGPSPPNRVENEDDPVSAPQITARLPHVDIAPKFTPSPPSTTAIVIATPPTPPLQRRRSQSIHASSRFHTGTTTSTHSIYHTPSSSLFDQFHSARTSPEASCDFRSRGGSYPRSASESPDRSPRRTVSTSSGSSGSALTMTPSLFARSSSNGHSIPTTTTTTVTSSTCVASQRRDRRPKLFFTSAKTGAGVAEVFEYIAWRVVRRWEHEEAIEARAMHVRETSTAETIRLGLAGRGGDAGRKNHGKGGICCAG